MGQSQPRHHRTREPRLVEIYDELNGRFFSGKLPKFKVVYSSNFSDGFNPRQLGECDEKRQLIRISPALRDAPGQLRQMLLHEMCHIGEIGHGKKFQLKLQRLANQGESWAALEAASYAEQPWPVAEAHIRQGLYDAALDLSREGQTLPHRLDQATANHLGWSLKLLRRSMPWVDSTWRNARREAIEIHEMMTYGKE